MVHDKSDRTWRGLIIIKIKMLKLNFDMIIPDQHPVSKVCLIH